MRLIILAVIAPTFCFANGVADLFELGDPNDHCKWYIATETRIKPGTLTEVGESQCKINRSFYMCAGLLACAKDFKFVRPSDSYTFLLARGYQNRVSCMSTKRCKDVTMAECLSDSHTVPGNELISADGMKFTDTEGYFPATDPIDKTVNE